MFNVQHSTFNLQPSTLNLQPSTLHDIHHELACFDPCGVLVEVCAHIRGSERIAMRRQHNVTNRVPIQVAREMIGILHNVPLKCLIELEPRRRLARIQNGMPVRLGQHIAAWLFAQHLPDRRIPAETRPLDGMVSVLMQESR